MKERINFVFKMGDKRCEMKEKTIKYVFHLYALIFHLQSFIMQAYFQRHRIFFMHLLFWCVYSSFFFYQVSSRHGEETEWASIIQDTVFQIVSMMFIAYLNYFVFLPRVLKHKNLGQYLLEFGVSFSLLIYGVVKGKQYIWDSCAASPAWYWLYSTRFTVNVILSSLFIVLFVGMLKFVEDWFTLEAKTKEIENEKLISELRFLKAQINPHFLFNTLNNLYCLAFSNSPNTTVVIDKLSQMMRYMIYDSNHAKVSLHKEIDYMQNYISLEKLRLNNAIPIRFDLVGNTIQGATFGENVQIVPLILITFLENAFKHGVSNNATDAWVNVTIELSGIYCIYTVENSKLIKKDEKTNEKSGIGLQNVQRRLDLSYPNQYDLEIENTAEHYLVVLKLQL
jgi:two-component system, LytTR family, sensor histidine kinase AlgZ